MNEDDDIWRRINDWSLYFSQLMYFFFSKFSCVLSFLFLFVSFKSVYNVTDFVINVTNLNQLKCKFIMCNEIYCLESHELLILILIGPNWLLDLVAQLLSCIVFCILYVYADLVLAKLLTS